MYPSVKIYSMSKIIYISFRVILEFFFGLGAFMMLVNKFILANIDSPIFDFKPDDALVNIMWIVSIAGGVIFVSRGVIRVLDAIEDYRYKIYQRRKEKKNKK